MHRLIDIREVVVMYARAWMFVVILLIHGLYLVIMFLCVSQITYDEPDPK